MWRCSWTAKYIQILKKCFFVYLFVCFWWSQIHVICTAQGHTIYTLKNTVPVYIAGYGKKHACSKCGRWRKKTTFFSLSCTLSRLFAVPFSHNCITISPTKHAAVSAYCDSREGLNLMLEENKLTMPSGEMDKRQHGWERKKLSCVLIWLSSQTVRLDLRPDWDRFSASSLLQTGF